MKDDIIEKLLKKIITDIAGPESEKLVDLLYNKQNVNEFLIAKKLNLTINQTRNMLYKLGDEGLVGFIRKKDKKKGGWYTYFWTLKVKKSFIKFREELLNGKENLEHQLKLRQTERHYYCENCELEYNEENAMLQEYTCTECGEVLQVMGAEKITIHLKEEIKKIDETLVHINLEVAALEHKELKATERKLKAEKKKKDLERRQRRLEREKEKKKLEKKLGKTKKKVKKVKKKTKKKKVKKKVSKKKSSAKKKAKKKR